MDMVQSAHDAMASEKPEAVGRHPIETPPDDNNHLDQPHAPDGPDPEKESNEHLEHFQPKT
jgi:hypothetical protein